MDILSKNNAQSLKVAIIHEWLTTHGGSEKVLESLLEIWPDAPVFTTVFDPNGQCRVMMEGHKVITSYIQKLPFATKKYRSYLPFMPLAIEQFDLSDFDVVISSSHAVAKGVITGPNQLHISYVHSPIRYAWDMQHQYLRGSKLNNGLPGFISRAILSYIRIWDSRTANGVDKFVANSNYIAKRIWKVYRRESEVIYPPVDISDFDLCEKKADFYFTASRMVPYKRMDLIVRAFSKMPDKRLIVIGDGPEYKKIVHESTQNVTFLGYQPRNILREYMQNAKAFIFAAEEDFGIIPVEAQACGTPVIAFGKGGALETVVDKKTGLFFWEQSVDSIVNSIMDFEDLQTSFDSHQIRENAEIFSKENFKMNFVKLVERVVKTQNY